MYHERTHAKRVVELEHQFLVAVNTLSLVKSDSLFSYTAPLNLLAWVLHPLRFLVPFRQFVKLNRTAIKVTHFPILMLIFLYERTALCSSMFDQTTTFQKESILPLVPAFVDRLDAGSRRFRGGSVVGSQHQEAALDEVFRKPYKNSAAMRAGRADVRSIGTGGVVDSWMKGVVSPTGSLTTDIEGGFAARRRALARGRRGLPRRESYGTIEGPRTGGLNAKYFTDASKSVISDPEEFIGKVESQQPLGGMALAETMTEGDADNEENSGDDEEMNEDTENPEAVLPVVEISSSPQKTMTPPRPRSLEFTKHSASPRPKGRTRANTSTSILYTPPALQSSEDEFEVGKFKPIPMSRKVSQRSAQGTGTPGENSSGKKTPRSSRPQTATRPRPILPSRKHFQSTSTLEGLSLLNDHEGRRKNSETMEDLANQDNIVMVPSSFATQMAMAIGAGGGVGSDMLGRLVLARIGTLEEGMKDVKDILKEVKKLSAKGKEKEKEKEKERERLVEREKDKADDKEKERGRERYREGEAEGDSEEGAEEGKKSRRRKSATSSLK